MRFFVEPWAPDYGSPVDFEEPGPDGENPTIEYGVEVPANEWQPITPIEAPARTVVFVDGVQRIDARLWLADDGGQSRMGACISVAAGVLHCDGQAVVESVAVRRYALGPLGLGAVSCGQGFLYEGVPVLDLTPELLEREIGTQREELEIHTALNARTADILVVDGHLKGRESIATAIGYIKTHQARYLTPELETVISRLQAGQRSPVFFHESWPRYSWYVRLPGPPGHPWAGIVRCEASPALTASEVPQFANFVTATLPRFASQPHKDPRAPQNLYPIGGLEREMRRRLGDQALLYRRLQVASRLDLS